MNLVFCDVKTFDAGARHQVIEQHADYHTDGSNGQKHDFGAGTVASVYEHDVQCQEDACPDDEEQHICKINNAAYEGLIVNEHAENI